MIDLLVAGGEVVSASSTARFDVGVDKGKIVFLASPGAIEVEARQVVDASGQYVIPGGVDAHVHFGFPLSSATMSQSSALGSRAAAFGGTTTFIDFARQQDAGSLLEAIETKRNDLKVDKPSIDYALHAMITGLSTLDTLDEIPDAIAEGVSSFKMFTTFTASDGSGVGALYSDDGRIWGVMKRAARHGGIVMVHSEDDSLIAHNIHCLYREGREQIANVAEARTGVAEEAAVRRMLLLSRRLDAPLYLCHITSRYGMEALFEARGRRVPAFGEVLHHNLSYTDEKYALPEGALYHTFPGLKSLDDQHALWEGITDGVVQSVSSDDFTFPRDVKLAGTAIDTVSAGHNGIETRMGVFFSSMVARRISINRFVALTSEGPARVFGLFPRKGLISPGSDADIVLIDPKADRTIRQSELHSDCDYSVWDGWHCSGYPTTTILGGNVLVQDGKWVGQEGGGTFIPCGSPSES